MPIIPQQETIVQYVANNAQLNYTFDFYAPLPTDIQVYLQAPNTIPVPAADILVLNVDYTVTYNADPISGGFITLLSAPTTGWILTINRQVAASLNTSFSNAQNFNGANLDAALDRLLLLCQQNQNYALERNLSYVINSYLPTSQPFTQLPVLAQNFIWIGSGSGVVSAEISTVPSASVLQSMLANNSPGTDGARLVGYYDAVNSNPTTVQAFLANLPAFLAPSLFQSGMMIDFAGTVAPTGFLLCDGSAVSRTTYASLFTAIGTTWGVGDGSTTFNVPDFRRRTAVGSGGIGSGTLGAAVGNTGGVETHTQTLSELVSHAHASLAPGTGIYGPCTPGTGTINFSTNVIAPLNNQSPNSTATQGGGLPFNIIQPSAIVMKIIKI